MSRNIEDIRKDINALDAQILKSFERRMELVQQVAAYKAERGLAVLDEARERALLERIGKMTENEKYAPFAQRLFTELMRYSRELQQALLTGDAHSVQRVRPKVVYQGIAGSYGEEAALGYFGEDVDAQSVSVFSEVFDAVMSGGADFGVLPIENSSTGGIGDVYDLFCSYRCSIAGEYILPIRHNLLGCPGARQNDITQVYSHPQGFEQCSSFLKHHPDWQLVPYHNTAISAKFVAQQSELCMAAIASQRAAKIYGLSVLAQNVNNNYNNYTRFVIIAKEASACADADKVSVMFQLPHKQGQLYKIISHFAALGVNMLKIESRPIPNQSWEYNFYVDFEGRMSEDDTGRLLEKLKADTDSFTLLGNYKSASN